MRAEICPSGRGCTQDDQAGINDLTNEARSAQAQGAVALVVGGIVTTGAVVFLLSSSSSSSGQSIAVTPVVAGEFGEW